MELLEFFNREESKYADLYSELLSDSSIFNDNAENVDQVEKSIITAINNRLERAATHCQGLNLLANFSSKVSKESLTKYFPHWSTKITQILTNAQSGSQEFTAVCRAIGAVFVSCKQVPELDKRVSIYSIKQIIGIINTRYSQEKNVALINLLVVLLYHYPESCARFQASFSQIISSCIDESKTHLISSGAKCYSLLVRAVERLFVHSSKDTVVILPDNSTASCHVYHQINLCNNLYGIIDDLFQDLVTTSAELPYELEHSHNINILQLSKLLCHDILDYYTALENRFANICTFLSTLLRVGGSKGKKFVLPNVVLQVICRGLAITPANLQKGSEDNKDILLWILPKLHCSLLNVLEALINSFQQELLPYAHTIQQLILQTLEWTHQSSYKSAKNIRLQSYRILTVWLQQTRSLSGFQLVADDFLVHIQKDLLPPNKNVLLLSTKKSENSSKTKTRKEHFKESKSVKDYSHNADSSICNSVDLSLCSQVLSTIQSIFSHVNCYLKQSFYDSVRNTVVLLLYEQYVQQISISVSKANIEYRLQLLKTLRILQTYGHVSTPSPTSHAIKLFGIAISQETNPAIVEEASLGLAETRHIVHPSAPTLVLLREVQEPESQQETQTSEIFEFVRSEAAQEVVNNKSDDNHPTHQFKRPRIEENKKENSPVQSWNATNSITSADSKNDENRPSLEKKAEENSQYEASLLTTRSKEKESNENGLNEKEEKDAEPKTLITAENSSIGEDKIKETPVVNIELDAEDHEMMTAFCDVES